MENTKKIMILKKIFFIFLISLSCANGNGDLKEIYNDTLYKDGNGNYFFKTYYHHPMDDGDGIFYIDQVIDLKSKKEIKLKNIINAEKFFRLPKKNYYSDESNIFYPPMGANYLIKKLDINAKNYTVLGDYKNYIKDQNNVYYSDKLILNADAKSFDIISLISFHRTPIDIIEIGFDDYNLFIGEEQMSFEDLISIKTFPVLECFLIKKYFKDKKCFASKFKIK